MTAAEVREPEQVAGLAMVGVLLDQFARTLLELCVPTGSEEMLQREELVTHLRGRPSRAFLGRSLGVVSVHRLVLEGLIASLSVEAKGLLCRRGEGPENPLWS